MIKSRSVESISIFFPAFNEAGNIKRVLIKADRVMRATGRKYEIIVVNDGSTDRTAQIVKKLKRSNSHIRLINHKRNLGYGAAVKTGLRLARYDLVFYSDGDGQFDIRDLNRALRLIRRADVVVGYRLNRHDRWTRSLNASLWKWLLFLVYGLNYKDIDCAFKLIRAKYIRNIKFKAQGAMISPELMLILERQSCRIKEMAVRHLPRVSGRATGASLNVIGRAMRELVQLFPSLAPQGRWQLIKFIIVGISNVAVDAGLYYVFSRFIFPSNLYLLARVISYGTGIVNNYYWNRRWTFRNHERKIVKQFTIFSITQLTIFAINMGLMFIVVSVLGWYDVYGMFITILFAALAGYLTNKFWIFRNVKSSHY